MVSYKRSGECMRCRERVHWLVAVTLTFSFTDEFDQFTDINNDGLIDTAIKEIYVNSKFPYCLQGSCTAANATTFPFQGYTFPMIYSLDGVLAHEIGHGLSLNHFNKTSINVKSGEIKVSPFSLMSTYQPNPIAKLQATDNASYCKTWNSWPNN